MTTTSTDKAVAEAPGSPIEATRRPAWYPRPYQVVALALALLFVAGVVGYAIGKPDGPQANDADVGFLEDMTYHHQQAISMGFAFLENSDSQDWFLLHQGREVVTQQSGEIRFMSELLTSFDERGDADIAMEWMDMRVPQDEMPGLADPAEVQRLATLTGAEAEEVFSRLLIEHHRGGVHMAEAAAELAENDQVKELARKMAKAQSSEIEEIEARRAELGFAPVG